MRIPASTISTTQLGGFSILKIHSQNKFLKLKRNNEF